jgi:hypothetical protein
MPVSAREGDDGKQKSVDTTPPLYEETHLPALCRSIARTDG